MVIAKPLPFVSAFIEVVDEAIRVHHPHHGLSAIQRAWLAFCLTAILVTNSVCWARFARASLCTYSLAALSWMFRQSKIPWECIASALLGGVQVISQIRSNQKMRVYQREQHVAAYFTTPPGTPHKVCVRGAENVAMRIGSARLYVSAHRTKRFVMALKYDGEEAYRYLVASDLSWRTLDIVQAHTLRWPVEVFVQDWKGYEGTNTTWTAHRRRHAGAGYSVLPASGRRVYVMD